MAETRDEGYTEFNPLEDYLMMPDHEFGIDFESVLTDLQLQGAMVLLQLVESRAIRLQFGVPPQGILAEAEVASVNQAAWWIRDQGVRHYRKFAQQHALWMGTEYAPATPKMRDYGCTCPDTPNVKKTGTYIVHKKCSIHGSR